MKLGIYRSIIFRYNRQIIIIKAESMKRFLLSSLLVITAPVFASPALDNITQSLNQSAQLQTTLSAIKSGHYAQAIQTLKTPAEKGNAQAAYVLGMMYENRYGVDKNLMKAVKWYHKAADQGNPFSQYRIVDLFSRKFTRNIFRQSYVKQIRKILRNKKINRCASP